MIISRTPLRISFFGGGTDYPAWYREHGGAVFSTTIRRYCYLTCRFMPPFFDHKSAVVWSEIERVQDNRDIKHPAVREALSLLRIEQGIDIAYNGDLPARTGLGSSSSLAVGILHALHALKGEMIGKADLARAAIYLERERLNEEVGVQDQIAASYGGLNRIGLRPDDTFKVEPVVLPPDRLDALQRHLLMFYTGVSRHSSAIAKDQIARIPSNRAELGEMHNMVDQGIDMLVNGSDLVDFGRLLHESWRLKKSLSPKVAPRFIDEIYDKGRAAGALGGKLLGAGGGGFVLLFVPPERHAAVLNALGNLLHVPTPFDTAGSQIVFYEPDLYSRTVLHGATFERFDANGSEGRSDEKHSPALAAE